MSNGPASLSPAARRRWIWLSYWACIAIATHVPVARTGIRPVPNIDKLLHVGMYFVLTLLGGHYLLAARQSIRPRVLILWAVIYGLYGVADEYVQAYTGRTASLMDWIANAVGIILATAWLSWRPRNAGLSEPGVRGKSSDGDATQAL